MKSIRNLPNQQTKSITRNWVNLIGNNYRTFSSASASASAAGTPNVATATNTTNASSSSASRVTAPPTATTTESNVAFAEPANTIPKPTKLPIDPTAPTAPKPPLNPIFRQPPATQPNRPKTARKFMKIHSVYVA